MSDDTREAVEGWTRVDDVELFTRSWLADSPVATVLLIHGLGDHSGRYDELAWVMVENGISVTGFDLRGHGRSPGGRGDAPSLGILLSDIDKLGRKARDQARRGAPWFVFGHSMGGLLALLYAVEADPPPLDGVLVSAPWLRTRAAVPRWKELLGEILLRVAPAWGIPTGLRPEDLSRDPEWVEAYQTDPRVHTRISPRLYDMVKRAQGRVQMARLNLPTLFLVPEEDPLVDSDVTQKLAEREGADVHVFPEFRHEGFGEVGRAAFFQVAARWILAGSEGG